ncbi:hypothetical protein CCMA1212_000843 [Trichoderma ghanense]|uniref:Uncharacterized protein n=1 Tax=Trichoderma ghanense TaxID=65468 RepID=A0ABY2HG35_9HYPO
MKFSTIFTLVPLPKHASLADINLFLPIWAFLFIVWVLTNVAIALWPAVFAYLSLVVAFAPDKNFFVAVASWLSLLRYWKPWASATADLRREVDLAIDCTFLAWFLMASPFVVLTIWAGLKEVLRLVANAIIRRIHHAMEFEFDLTDYVVECYSPMTPRSWGDRVYRRMFPDFDYYRDEYLKYNPRVVEVQWWRTERPTPREPYDPNQVAENRRIREWARQKLAEVRAAKEQAKIAAEQLSDPTPTPSDSEPVPQSREAAAPAVQSSAWPTAVPGSDPVADDATTASKSTETEEPADQKESKGEGLVGAGPKAPEPEVSPEAEGNGLLEGAEDSRAQEPECSHEDEEEGESSAEEPKSSAEEAGEGPLCIDSLEAQEPESSHEDEEEGESFPAEEPKSSPEEEGEGPLQGCTDSHAQEPEFAFEKEGDGFMAEEPETSHEEEGEGPAQEPETSPEEEGESSLFVRAPAYEPEASIEVEGEAMSAAKVPQAAQEPEASPEVEGDGMPMVIDTDRTEEPEASTEVEGEGDGVLMIIDSAQTEEPEVSVEAEGEGSTKNEASIEVEFDVEMADVDLLVPRLVFPSGNPSSPVPILPLEVVAPWSPAGQAPGVHDETRGCMALSPVVEGAQILDGIDLEMGLSSDADMLPYLDNEYASMDPDLLDHQIDNLLADTDGPEASFVNDDDFEAFASFLSSVPDDVVVSFPGADAYDDDEVMQDVAFARPAPFDSFDDDSDTIQDSPISEFFGLGILRDSGLDEEMASLDLNGAAADPEVESLTAALARLTLTLHVGGDVTMEQQPSSEDGAMVVPQGPIPPATVVVDMVEPEEPVPPSSIVEMAEPEEAIPPVTVVDMAEPEEPVPPTSNPTELNGPISPAIEVIPVTESAQPEEPTPDVDDIVPDAAPDSPQSASPPRWPFVFTGEGEEDWREQSAWSDDGLPPQVPSRPSTPHREAEIRPGISPGSSLEEEMICALLGIAPGNLSRSPSPASDNEDAPLHGRRPRWCYFHQSIVERSLRSPPADRTHSPVGIPA